jgi:hypothetical protein
MLSLANTCRSVAAARIAAEAGLEFVERADLLFAIGLFLPQKANREVRLGTPLSPNLLGFSRNATVSPGRYGLPNRFVSVLRFCLSNPLMTEIHSRAKTSEKTEP